MTGDPPPTDPVEQAGPVEQADPARRFSDVFDAYFAEIHRYAAKRLGPDAAADVAAQAFLEAFRQRRRYDPHRASVRTWLYGDRDQGDRPPPARRPGRRACQRSGPARRARPGDRGAPAGATRRAPPDRPRRPWPRRGRPGAGDPLRHGRLPPGAAPPQKGSATAPQQPVNLDPRAAILLAATRAAQQPTGTYWHTDMVSGQSCIAPGERSRVRHHRRRHRVLLLVGPQDRPGRVVLGAHPPGRAGDAARRVGLARRRLPVQLPRLVQRPLRHLHDRDDTLAARPPQPQGGR
jgi:hypothetical protein